MGGRIHGMPRPFMCGVVAVGEYRLWHLPPDIIDFERALDFAMEFPLSSCANVFELLEFLEVIEATDSTAMPE